MAARCGKRFGKAAGAFDGRKGRGRGAAGADQGPAIVGFTTGAADVAGVANTSGATPRNAGTAPASTMAAAVAGIRVDGSSSVEE